MSELLLSERLGCVAVEYFDNTALVDFIHATRREVKVLESRPQYNKQDFGAIDAQLKMEITALQSEIATLRDAIAAREADREKLKAEIAALRRKIAEVEKQYGNL